jgi:hypothetical protein
VQVTPSAIIPTLLSADNAAGYRPGDPDAPILEDYGGDLVVGYAAGPPVGGRLVSEGDLEALDLKLRALRRTADANLARLLGRVEIHGLPPVFTLACERIFFAGHDNLLSRDLLSRRDGGWDRF